MCKTTKGTQAAASPEAVRTARRTTTPGGGNGTGGTPQNRPAPSPTGPEPLIGEPEFLPQQTFISVPLPGDNGFIANAVAFHENAGIEPHNVGSIEEILELLANPAETGAGLLDRIRIVSHFFVPDPGGPDQPSNMGINFLRNGGRGALKIYFEGFAESSIAGLRALLTFDLTGPPPRTTHLFFIGESGLVLSALRSAGHGDLVDELPLDPLGDIANTELEEFVLICASKWILQHESIISDPTCLANQQQAYDTLLNHLRTRLTAAPSSIPEARLNALRDAILGLGTIAGATFPTGLPAVFLNRHCANVSAGLAAFAGDSFRNKLLAVRPRFDRFTTIDIRGCQAGRDTDYLAAVQRFLGRTDSVRPVVTAPNWFQRFNQIGTITPHGTTPQARAAVINNLHNNGAPPLYTGATVRTQFAPWASAFGIDTHLAFWHTTFQLHVLEFSQLQWRAAIPARNVTISRLEALAGAGFGPVFNLLGEIFFVANGQRPTGPQIAAITPLLPNLNTWTTQLNTAVPAGASAAQLTTHFNNFKTIYEAVDARMDNPGFPTSPQRLIPAAEPAGFDVDQANTMRNNLRTFINANPNSRFAPVHNFLTAADGLTQGAPALMRYHLSLALPFQLFDLASTNFDAQRLIVFEDQVGDAADRRQHEAIRHWIRAAWRGVSPPEIPDAVTFDLGRHSAWLVEGRNQGPSAICPHSSYMSHIITQPA